MQRERETRPRDEDEDDDVVGLNKRRRKGQSQKNPPSRIIQQAPPSPLCPTTNYEDVVVDKVVIDWRGKSHRLSVVGDQGNLPLCWVFSILSTIETILEMRTGKVIQLSKQQLIDFVWTWKSHDMRKGHSVSETLDFIKKNGITTEDEYKYVGDKSKSERTIEDLKFKDLLFIKEYGKVTDTVDISRILKDGPLVIRSKFGISFRYVNDWSIFIPKEDENMYNPHGLVLVGEGKEIIDGAELYYWIVKNSWGTDWGEKGFGRIIKNDCNLKIEAWYPIL